MSNWTPKQALSGLMSKFRQSASEELSSSSSVEETTRAGSPAVEERDEPGEALGLSTSDVEVSPLALMNENSPEAWLGQFLLKLDAPTSTRRGTLEGARRDPELKEYLVKARSAAGQASPLDLLDPEHAAQLRARDWAAWWRAQGSLLGYTYSTLALALLGDEVHVDDLRVMYSQESNLQIRKDTHYVICCLLGKMWPSYDVVPSDFDRLRSRSE